MPAPGDVIGGKFQLVRELGRGTFGIVYEAQQLDLARRVAIKLLQSSMLEKEGVAERFTREARLASSLTNPHAVTIYAYGNHALAGTSRGLPFIAMELLEGHDLQGYTVRRRGIPVEHGLAIVLQALTGLAQAHRLGIIHRDVKPENIFLARRPDGRYHVKMLDFGIAKAISGNWGNRTMAGVTMVGHVVGTPSFMAPEQARGEPDLTPAVDTYAMACVAFDILAGRPPYEGRTPMEIALNHITQPTPLLPGQESSPLGEVIYEAMSKEPLDRYQDATTFAAALRDAAERGGIVPDMPLWTQNAIVDLQPARDDEGHPTYQHNPLDSESTRQMEGFTTGDELLARANTELGPALTTSASSMPTRVFLQGMTDDEPAPMSRDTAPDGRQATAMVPAMVPPAAASKHKPQRPAAPVSKPPATPEESGSRWLLVATILAGLVFLLVGAVLALVLVTRSSGEDEISAPPPRLMITVDTVPSGAQVLIDGVGSCSPTPCDIKPPDRAFKLEIRKEGYASQRKSFSRPPTDRSLNFSLKAIPTSRDEP